VESLLVLQNQVWTTSSQLQNITPQALLQTEYVLSKDASEATDEYPEAIATAIYDGMVSTSAYPLYTNDGIHYQSYGPSQPLRSRTALDLDQVVVLWYSLRLPDRLPALHLSTSLHTTTGDRQEYTLP
jgi:hypothetical protein